MMCRPPLNAGSSTAPGRRASQVASPSGNTGRQKETSKAPSNMSFTAASHCAKCGVVLWCSNAASSLYTSVKAKSLGSVSSWMISKREHPGSCRMELVPSAIEAL